MQSAAQRRAERERTDAAIYIGLPRIVGTPEEVAAEVRRRSLAQSVGFVYVGAYVRRRPARRKKHQIRRAA